VSRCKKNTRADKYSERESKFEPITDVDERNSAPNIWLTSEGKIGIFIYTVHLLDALATQSTRGLVGGRGTERKKIKRS
jgi:hypothetical protein